MLKDGELFLSFTPNPHDPLSSILFDEDLAVLVCVFADKVI